jgi:hypothetical protein
LARYQTAEGDDAMGTGDDTVPEAAAATPTAAAADNDDAGDLFGGGMAIPPELTTLLRCVSFLHTHTARTCSLVVCRVVGRVVSLVVSCRVVSCRAYVSCVSCVRWFV